ncbi:MAG: type IV fimbrial biogenesis protein FimT [Pseudomonadales bacterium]|jgi:type IV fimbrial biogenesis protein FimT
MTTQHNKQGFTLIELLVVIAIAAILATIAAPSFVDMTKNSRINGAANEFQSIVQLARTEAITRNAIVNLYNSNADGDWSGDIYLCEASTATTVCASNDVNFIKKFTIGDLSDDNVSNGDITIDSNSDGDSFISLGPNGRLSTTTAITIAFCDNRIVGNRDFQLLTISVTGRPSVNDLGIGSCVR